jgi:ATPase family AAA domain-containing protein 3A/B
MMVYASNQPAQFDAAIMDRIDEMVSFDLPGSEERRKMIAMYIDKFLLNPPGRWSKPVVTEGIAEEEIDNVVNMTDGFSGRAISEREVVRTCSE